MCRWSGECLSGWFAMGGQSSKVVWGLGVGGGRGGGTYIWAGVGDGVACIGRSGE